MFDGDYGPMLALSILFEVALLGFAVHQIISVKRERREAAAARAASGIPEPITSPDEVPWWARKKAE